MSKGGSSSAINSSSFLNLKADLAKKKSEEKSGRSSKEEKSKKLPAFLRPSPGVLSRSSKDSSSNNAKANLSNWASTPSAQLDAARAAMERKSKMYDKLRRGKQGGLNEESIVGGLIDWDRKDDERRGNDSVDEDSDEERRWKDPENRSEEDGEDSNRKSKRRKDESLGEEDPLITYKDEFGRSRTVPQSEVPRDVLRAMELESSLPKEDSNAQYGPATSFPIYRPPSPVLEARGEALKDTTTHFDADFETRDRGAAFYRFSTDEQTRKEEMERMKLETEETERKRKEKSGLDKSEEEEKMNLETTYCKDQSQKQVPTRRPLTAFEKRQQARKLEVDAKRKEIYGEEETKRLEDERVEAFLNQSLNL